MVLMLWLILYMLNIQNIFLHLDAWMFWQFFANERQCSEMRKFGLQSEWLNPLGFFSYMFLYTCIV